MIQQKRMRIFMSKLHTNARALLLTFKERKSLLSCHTRLQLREIAALSIDGGIAPFAASGACCCGYNPFTAADA